MTVAVQSPAATIAANVAKASAISSAKDEAALTAAMNATAEATAETGAAATATFVKDKTAWQNMDLPDMIAAEATRADFMPFVIGGVVTYLLLGVGLPMALPKDDGSSNYMKLIEGKH